MDTNCAFSLRWVSLGAILAALLLTGGCTFESGLSGLECDTENATRPGGEICQGGYWRIREDVASPRDATDSGSTTEDVLPGNNHPADVTPPQDTHPADTADTRPGPTDVIEPADITPSDTTQPDTNPSDTTQPDTNPSDTTPPDTTQPDTNEPPCNAPNIRCGGTCVDLSADPRNDGNGLCATGLPGICAAGTLQCVGNTIECVQKRQAMDEELCQPNGLGNDEDENCNGITDEGCKVCLDGDTKGCYDGPDGTRGVGICTDGTQTCAGGQWGACTGAQHPQAEQCNGLDNNCDGRIDGEFSTTTTLCGANQACVHGECCNTRTSGNRRCNGVLCNSNNNYCLSGYCHDIRNVGTNSANDICLPEVCRTNINDSACLEYLTPTGEACSVYTECASQYCVDGLCCDNSPGSALPCAGRKCSADSDCPSGNRCRSNSNAPGKTCR